MVSYIMFIFLSMGLPCGSESTESACNAGDPGSVLGLGRSPGEGNGNPVQNSRLESLSDRGACDPTEFQRVRND